MARRIESRLDGLVVIEPEVFGDDRGFLVETFRDDLWRELGVDLDFVQHNHSRSVRNTLRGLHFQTEPGQAKLVRCSAGRIFDVAVDLRRDSPTFGQWEGHELDDQTHRQLLVPIGFGHGFCVLSETADVDYQLSSYYDPATEAGSPGTTPTSGSNGRSTSRCSRSATSRRRSWPTCATSCRSRRRAQPGAIPARLARRCHQRVPPPETMR